MTIHRFSTFTAWLVYASAHDVTDATVLPTEDGTVLVTEPDASMDDLTERAYADADEAELAHADFPTDFFGNPDFSYSPECP